MVKKLLIVLFCMLASLPLRAEDNLAYTKEWLKLLHYKESTFGGYKGLVDADKFYADENGRYNPQKEMETEIRLFNKDDTIKCEFPARFEWLKQKGLVRGDLKNCKEYQDFIKDIQPNGITILFTDAFMSNPASLFGHTLIRIDTARKGSQMLAHGSNFGANSGTDSGPIFAFKGLVGLYYGGYVISPYWDVINTYNNIENRDIWEYHLNLTDEEQIMFVNHLYEMKNALIRYFFLSKNCSYMILELLESVRPELELTKDYNYWAIPLDTLKTIKDVPDLVDDINYRPARFTKLQAQINSMDKAQYKAFYRGIKEHDYEMSDLPEDEQPLVLEAEYQYYQYIYTAGDMELKDYRKNSFAVLRKRSSMPPAPEIKPVGKDPSLSHASFQMSFGGGVYNHKSFEQINVRPAYTALTDDNFGLIKGAGISVLETQIRYYNQTDKAVLERVTGLKIDSFVPASKIFSPWSYLSDINVHREYNPSDNSEGYVGEILFGMGKTYALTDWFWVYGILSAKGQYGGFITGNQWGGAAPEVGVFSDLGKVKIHFATEKVFATRKFADRLVYKTEAAYMLTKDWSLATVYNVSHNDGGHNRQELSGWLRYSF